MTNWMDFKALMATLLLEKDAMHIYSAFLVQIVAAHSSRKDLRDWQPWLAVLLFALFNESLDIMLGEEARIKPWQVRGATHDLLNTMALPTALLLLCRYWPSLFAAADRTHGPGTGPDQC